MEGEKALPEAGRRLECTKCPDSKCKAGKTGHGAEKKRGKKFRKLSPHNKKKKKTGGIKRKKKKSSEKGEDRKKVQMKGVDGVSKRKGERSGGLTRGGKKSTSVSSQSTQGHFRKRHRKNWDRWGKGIHVKRPSHGEMSC